jgi:hypothetical protein
MKVPELFHEVDDNKFKYKINVPYTAESLYYRQRFCETFSNDIANVIPYLDSGVFVFNASTLPLVTASVDTSPPYPYNRFPAI